MDQNDLREKIEDLNSTLTVRNVRWSAWELEFIESMAEKLDGPQDEIRYLTPNVKDKIVELWEKI